MKIHFIAIGGAVMHNLAMALQGKGYQVTGSDDEIFEPSRSRLKSRGLLPEKEGWYPDHITADIDTIILGMHAREGNPELIRARELGLTIQSFPELLYEQTRKKTRVVIGGSHGKTTITSMILHVLKDQGLQFDYMVGSQIDGFETMVGLSEEAEVAVLEGDEYLTSALDHRPKFHLYQPHIAVISGIAWDHMNVFPTEESYVEQFRLFVEQIEVGGSLIYCADDITVADLAKHSARLLDYLPYREHRAVIREGRTFLVNGSAEYPVPFFGKHNMQNVNAARLVCEMLGVDPLAFYQAMGSFPGAGRRMEMLGENGSTAVYLDFAHAPSKVRATTTAIKDQYPERGLTAVLELHTYSSLNRDFLPQYRSALSAADQAIVYYNPKTVEHKKLPALSIDQVKEAFGREDLVVSNDAQELMSGLLAGNLAGRNLVIMTSGDFDGQDLRKLAMDILHI